MSDAEAITEAPKDCDDTGTVWETGKRLFELSLSFVLS